MTKDNTIPISVIEDIKAELKSLESPFGVGEWYDAIAECIAVIDKHMESVSK